MPETLTDPYAIIKTGGKQYRVAPGDELLVERLAGDEGASIELEPLLLAGGGKDAKFGGDLGKAVVTATIVGHERGPKIRVFKYKPKRGYKRTQGHRQELTRIRVEKIGS
jgi:large subunit ribosomal protein L21